MALVQTLVAQCDGRIAWPTTSREYGCSVTQELDPDDTQPFRTLTKLGWTMVNVKDEIQTLCPKHTQPLPEETHV